jgi:hypothetical protein
MTFGLFNVIVAVYVESTVSAAKGNEMKKKEQRLRNDELFREKSLELAVLAYSLKTGAATKSFTLGSVDLNEVYSMEFNHSEFLEICQNAGFCELLDELDIAKEDHPVLFDVLDVDRGGTLDVNELINGISKLRGDVRKSDLVTIIVGVRHLGHLLRNFKAEARDVFEQQGVALAQLDVQISRAVSSWSQRDSRTPVFTPRGTPR